MAEKFRNSGEFEILKGSIENVVYYNDSNDYAVLEVLLENNLIITAVGTMPIPFEGECVILRGRWGYHKEFGKQFEIVSYEKTLPRETEGILQYLSSRTVKGIGPVTARKIVERFGADTFDVIENHPEWLADIPGITMKKASAISESFLEQNGLRDVIMFCNDYMTVTEATKVYKRLGAGAVGIITKNPYVLCEGENSLPFAKADEIAMRLGFTAENSYRVRSGISYVLEYNARSNGHTCLPIDKLVKASSETLGISEDVVSAKLNRFIKLGEFALYTRDDKTFVMTTDTNDTEDYIARRLVNMDSSAPRFSTDDITSLIENLEYSLGITYERLQKKAIYEALCGGVTIITGGPGTGKTTIVKALIALFKNLNQRIVLAAPTGRAAKRMSEATSAEAKTIHRMLEMERGDLDVSFGRNAANPLDESVCIVDEASMIDVNLMQALVRAMRRGSRLVLIGDANQLPSVGAGNVLYDLIDSKCFRTVELTEIFRQSKESLIVTNAHKINRGEAPNLATVDGDFFFVSRGYERDIPSTVASLVTERLPKKYGAAIREGIQIITPSKKGAGGVEALNAELQAKINPRSGNKREKSAHETVFREGDKVMQTVNNYDIVWRRGSQEGVGIFNGDIGVIESIDINDSVMTIRFDDRIATYGFDLLDELELAYAITVHKSQGSEYPVVIIPAYSCPPMLMTRNLLYTAVTRAKKMVIMVGRAEIVTRMVSNNSELKRYTTLKDRIINYNNA